MSDKTKIMLTRHHDISAFCGTDESRLVLTGVHYDTQHKRLEATDGRMLAYLPVIESGEVPPIDGLADGLAKSCLIPGKVLSEAICAISKSATLDTLKRVVLDTPENADGKVLLTTTDLDTDRAFYAKCIDGNYPNTQQLIDTHNAPAKFTMSLSPRLFKILADYASEHSRENDPMIQFEFTENADPVRITVPLEEGTEFKALLMGLRPH